MILPRVLVLLGWLILCGPVGAETLTLPPDKRPEWLARDGIVMAGSWEPLVFRVRRDGKDYVPTAEQARSLPARAQPGDGRAAQGPGRQLRDDALLQRGRSEGGAARAWTMPCDSRSCCHDAGFARRRLQLQRSAALGAVLQGNTRRPRTGSCSTPGAIA